MIHLGHDIKNNTHIGAGCLQLDLGLNTSGSDKNRELDYRLVIEFRAGYWKYRVNSMSIVIVSVECPVADSDLQGNGARSRTLDLLAS